MVLVLETDVMMCAAAHARPPVVLSKVEGVRFMLECLMGLRKAECTGCILAGKAAEVAGQGYRLHARACQL